MTLNEGKIDELLIVNKIAISRREKRRLYDLGIVPGSIISKKFNSMFKDPICYEVKGTRVALRNREAKCIEVGKYYG